MEIKNETLVESCGFIVLTPPSRCCHQQPLYFSCVQSKISKQPICIQEDDNFRVSCWKRSRLFSHSSESRLNCSCGVNATTSVRKTWGRVLWWSPWSRTGEPSPVASVREVGYNQDVEWVDEKWENVYGFSDLCSIRLPSVEMEPGRCILETWRNWFNLWRRD